MSLTTRIIATALWIVISFSVCLAGQEVVDGVQPAALDQPRIYLHFHRTAKGPALSPPARAGKNNDWLGAPVDDDHRGDVEAFLDTGASGVMLSKDTAAQLGIAAKPNVVFEDIGVAGVEESGWPSRCLSLSQHSAAAGRADSARRSGRSVRSSAPAAASSSRSRRD